jgi:hypothetical protein
MAKPTQQHPGAHKHPGVPDAGGARAGAGTVGPKSTIRPSKGTTRPPTDRDIVRGGIRPDRPHPEMSEAGGVG